MWSEDRSENGEIGVGSRQGVTWNGKRPVDVRQISFPALQHRAHCRRFRLREEQFSPGHTAEIRVVPAIPHDPGPTVVSD